VDEQDLRALLDDARRAGTTLTAAGGQTSTTGASLAESGLLVSFERMARVLDVDVARGVATCEPGVGLGELQRVAAAHGLRYAPDPTSEDECTLGGSLATNATGARTLRYGATRRWVEALDVLTLDGRLHRLERRQAQKDNTGYAPLRDPIDWFVGSEGTLGLILRARVRLLPRPGGQRALLVFFRRLTQALDTAVALSRAAALRPASVELLDRFGLLAETIPDFVRRVPEGATAALHVELEEEEPIPDEDLGAWLSFLDAQGALVDDTIVATDATARRRLRRVRHALPSRFNQLAEPWLPRGGGKLSMDWAVPPSALAEAIELSRRTLEELNPCAFSIYGHVGSGHPHVNLLARDADELSRFEAALEPIYDFVLAKGGAVIAEHGVGKVKRDLFRGRTPPMTHAAMLALKRVLDPEALLAPGNLFTREEVRGG
jgi:glycolate oxidase